MLPVLVIIVIAVTFFSLVIGELLPKRIGLSNPETIAKYMAGPMELVSLITYPFTQTHSDVPEDERRRRGIDVGDGPRGPRRGQGEKHSVRRAVRSRRCADDGDGLGRGEERAQRSIGEDRCWPSPLCCVNRGPEPRSFALIHKRILRRR